MKNLIPLAVLVLVGLIALAVMGAMMQKKAGMASAGRPAGGRFRRQDSVLSKAELTFLAVLDAVIPPHTRLYPQVLLRCIITAVNDPQTRTRDQNQINQKYVDFLLCDAWSRPLLVIELDDSSHNSARRRGRDEFLEAALASAGVPLLRVPARGSYDAHSLQAQMFGLLNAANTTVSA